jgi:hypothetical protein
VSNDLVRRKSEDQALKKIFINVARMVWVLRLKE